jgi:hypothetical protein
MKQEADEPHAHAEVTGHNARLSRWLPHWGTTGPSEWQGQSGRSHRAPKKFGPVLLISLSTSMFRLAISDLPEIFEFG